MTAPAPVPWYSTHCGGDATPNDAHPSLDDRYPLGRCKHRKLAELTSSWAEAERARARWELDRGPVAPHESRTEGTT